MSDVDSAEVGSRYVRLRVFFGGVRRLHGLRGEATWVFTVALRD